MDPKLVPDNVQLHVPPPIRPPLPDLPASADTDAEDCARYKAEIQRLKNQCNVLHWRSGVASATIAGLTCLAKMARDQALRMKSERDSFEQRYNALKRHVREWDEQ